VDSDFGIELYLHSQTFKVCALLQLEKLHVSTTQIMKLGCKDPKVALYSEATKARSTMYSKVVLQTMESTDCPAVLCRHFRKLSGPE
jgi:hypothetical protein